MTASYHSENDRAARSGGRRGLVRRRGRAALIGALRVLAVDPEVAVDWSDDEVVRR